MEESLIDFEEKKKTYAGPKASQKVKVKRVKQIKVNKGQKDIKTLFKKKKSELVTFTKDFNEVCLKSGIDVDSQQLQLAIALSKSLQQTAQIEAENIQTTQFVSSQDRTNRIRKTLQEYGFKVSGTNIKPAANRRSKTCRKSYKLLLITREEKLKKINDRYKQILLENPCKFIGNEEINCKIVESGLYHFSTSITYESMKNSEIFYVCENLSEISNTKGNLLKNWADIPGRPSSPIEREDFIFSLPDIECAQTELDIMLSGTLKATKDICRTKIINNSSLTKEGRDVQSTNNFVLKTESFSDSAKTLVINSKKSELTDNIFHRTDDIHTSESNDFKMLSLSQPNRSQSPDIFDEEDTTIIYDNVKKKYASEKLVNNMTKSDLRKYENPECNQCSPQQSQNLTTRKTNDFMDLTDCVPVASQKFEHKTKSNLETTNKLQLVEDNMEITECVYPISLGIDQCACDLIDLTQQVGNSLAVSKKKPVVIKENFSSLDLTQSSNSDDDLPAVEISGTQQVSSEDTVIINYDNYFDIELSPKSSNLCDDENACLEEVEEINSEHSSVSYDVKKSEHDTRCNNVSANNFDTASVEYGRDNSVGIDLTQSSDSDSEICDQNSYTKNIHNTQSVEYNSIGKKDNVSIDYDNIHQYSINMYSLDEKFDNIYSKNANISKTVYLNEESIKHNIISNNNTVEHFDLTDEELNNSIAKSTAEIFDQNNTLLTEKFQNSNKKKIVYNWKDNVISDRSINEEDLPSVNVNCRRTNDIEQQTESHITSSNSTCSTPVREVTREDQISIKTPTNSDYVVKTGNVTPMLDYGAMSSPEMNRELEKYGLKSFKRKRAIQLLTHLYNQTHPFIEYCSEEPVLAKKFKPDSNNRPLTINEKADKDEDIQVTDTEIETNIYRLTKDLPDIRDIECSEEDWVFQKKEKAKVRTCRVPLHIAFHNYVSCRSALREAILRYEPINIDVIHKDLISYGYKYNPKDLLKFLDKRCITVKTADSNGRSSKK